MQVTPIKPIQAISRELPKKEPLPYKNIFAQDLGREEFDIYYEFPEEEELESNRHEHGTW